MLACMQLRCTSLCRSVNGSPRLHVVQPCELYWSTKPAYQHLLVGAAALYWLTGDESYRKDADEWYSNTSKDIFHNQWDNSILQVRVPVQFVVARCCTPSARDDCCQHVDVA
jgi:hypothetical protein